MQGAFYMWIQGVGSWLRKVRQSAFAFPVAVLVALAMVSFSEVAYQQARSQMEELTRMNKIRLELATLIRRITDAESGQRGYLLTGRPEYLDPYRHAAADAREALTNLASLYEGVQDREALQRLAAVQKTANTKLSELGLVLTKFDSGDLESARGLLDSGIGRDQMESLRHQVDAMMALQSVHIAQVVSNVFDTLLLNRVGVAALTAISLLVLVMFLRQGRQIVAERVAQSESLQRERDRLEEEVARRTEELTELARHLQTAREDERARLARELHDELGALLTAAKLDVARLKPKLQPAGPEAMERLGHLTSTLNNGIALKRRIIEDLRPSTLSNLGLVPALEVLCNEFGQRSGVEMHVALRPVPLSPNAELTVFRLVQEALTNTAKYAQATEVWVSLEDEEGQVRVQVRDNGKGFDTQAPRSARHGLLGMHYRVEAERGQLSIESAPGQGTRLTACLPLSPAMADTPPEIAASAKRAVV